MLHEINLRPVIVLGQGREKEAVEQGQPPAVWVTEDRKQMLPVLVSCQKEAGPLFLSWLWRRNSIRGRTSCQKIRAEAAGWEANCCLNYNFVECLTKKGHFFLPFDLFLAVVNMICTVGWPFYVHFQLRAEDPVFHNSQLFLGYRGNGLIQHGCHIWGKCKHAVGNFWCFILLQICKRAMYAGERKLTKWQAPVYMH